VEEQCLQRQLSNKRIEMNIFTTTPAPVRNPDFHCLKLITDWRPLQQLSTARDQTEVRSFPLSLVLPPIYCARSEQVFIISLLQFSSSTNAPNMLSLLEKLI